MNNSGKLYCFDMYEHRLKLINDGAKRLDIVNISASVNDATNIMIISQKRTKFFAMFLAPALV
ncbi:MAG: hypothetical protein ACLS26_08245 [Eubacterium sp.]